MKRILLRGLLVAFLSFVTAYVYNELYTWMMLADFSAVINVGSLAGSNVFGAIVIAVGYFVYTKKLKIKNDIWFNIAFLILTFASFAGPILADLPLDIAAPELFIGLTIPMHLLPALYWFAVEPLFKDR